MTAQETFYHALAAELSSVNSGIGPGTPKLGTLGLGQRFMDIVKKVFNSIDVTNLTREEFLSAVAMAFDTFIAPSLAVSPMAALITPLVKALVLSLAAKFYDNQKNT